MCVGLSPEYHLKKYTKTRKSPIKNILDIISNKITSLEKIKKFNQFKFKFYEFDNKNNKFLFISK